MKLNLFRHENLYIYWNTSNFYSSPALGDGCGFYPCAVTTDPLVGPLVLRGASWVLTVGECLFRAGTPPQAGPLAFPFSVLRPGAQEPVACDGGFLAGFGPPPCRGWPPGPGHISWRSRVSVLPPVSWQQHLPHDLA